MPSKKISYYFLFIFYLRNKYYVVCHETRETAYLYRRMCNSILLAFDFSSKPSAQVYKKKV